MVVYDYEPRQSQEGVNCSPEQLGIDKGDDILQEFEGWANQKVGTKGFEERP